MSEGAQGPTLQERTELKVYALQFEKQSNQLVVGTDRGYRLINYLDPNCPIVKRGLLNQSIKIIKLVPMTKCLIYVSNDAPETANFYDYGKSTEFIPPKSFTKPITAVKASSNRIAIAQENCIHLYDSTADNFMTKLHHILLTMANTQGLMDLSEHDFNTYIAYPFSSQKGMVEIFDCHALKPKILFDAHNGPIVAISFSPTGRSLATASDKGTLIRIHIVFTGECVYEFRKSMRTNTINSLGFGLDSTFLSVTSDTTSIHIFKLQSRTSSSAGASFAESIFSLVSVISSDLVKILSQDRAFAIAKLPVPEMNTISMVHRIENTNYLIVATYDGYLYSYRFGDEPGGKCDLLNATIIDQDEVHDPDEAEWVMIDKTVPQSQTDKDLAL